jgi:hypothetical protein
MQAHKSKYQAAAAANVVVAAGKAILHRILIGADVATSTILVANDPADGQTDPRLKFAGSTLMTATGGCIEVGAIFEKGISADITNQTDVTFIWEPIA